MAENEKVPYAEFGERLVGLREEHGMTRKKLAELCGVAQSTVINYEKGTRIPYADTAVRMAQVFGMTVEELLGMDNLPLAMQQAEALDKMRSINGKKGEARLQRLYGEAARLAEGDLPDDKLLELSMELQKAALLAQQKLTERFTNRTNQGAVERKAEKTAEAVKAINAAVALLTSEDE